MLKCYRVREKFRIAAFAAAEKGLLVDANGKSLRPIPTVLIRAINKQGFALNYETLKVNWNNHAIFPAQAAALANFLGFSATDERFCDPTVKPAHHELIEADYPGRDSLAAFTKLVREALRLPYPTTRLQAVQQSFPSLSLVSFDVTGGQPVADGTPHEGYLHIRFDKGVFDDFEYGVRKARLRIIPADNTNARFEATTGRRPFDIEGLLITDVGLATVPQWELASKNGALDGRFVCEQPLFKVFNTFRGYRLRVELAIQPIKPTLHFYGDAPSPVREAVIRSLIDQATPGVRDGSGWVTLGWQLLAVTDGREGAVRLENGVLVR